MDATYTKLKSGDWGLRVAGKPAPGDTVSVNKKSGGSDERIVARVLWTGDQDGKTVSLCTIGSADGGKCDNCGRYSPSLHKRYDSSGIEGRVCSSCDRDSSEMLSFA